LSNKDIQNVNYLFLSDKNLEYCYVFAYYNNVVFNVWELTNILFTLL